MTTHAELVAAINDLRPQVTGDPKTTRVRNAHLDLCAAVLNLHTPAEDFEHEWCDHDEHGWPCPTVGIVADVLRKMGAL